MVPRRGGGVEPLGLPIPFDKLRVTTLGLLLCAGGLCTSIFADYVKGFSLQSLTQHILPNRIRQNSLRYRQDFKRLRQNISR